MLGSHRLTAGRIGIVRVHRRTCSATPAIILTWAAAAAQAIVLMIALGDLLRRVLQKRSYARRAMSVILLA